MRNWMKSIRDFSIPVTRCGIHGGVSYPLKNGRMLRAADILRVGDLQSCEPTGGSFPPETITVALVENTLYLADSARGEMHVIDTLPSE